MSNEKAKNKLVNSMRMTKAGTAKSTTSEDKKEAVAKESKPAKKAATPSKKAASAASGYTSTGFTSGRRIWPD